jgi:hypothetical protein
VSAAPTLPVIHNAKLPQSYEAAKNALAECSRIDECQEWADKAEALASYAKQAKDEQLRKLADRIQARAIRRCGELLKQFDARGDHRKSGDTPTSQRAIAREAGLSKDQQVTAVRVANVSAEDFESAVESEKPPTVTKLAELGKKTQQPKQPLVDLKGVDPREFAISTDGSSKGSDMAEWPKDLRVREFPQARSLEGELR